MRLGLRLFLGVFLIVGVAAFFVMRVFVGEVKPGVRQSMEATLVDTASVLAPLAADDLRAGRIADGAFARAVADARQHPVDASIWTMRKQHFDYRIYVTDARGIVRYDSSGLAVGQDYSRWRDVYLTLHGRYGARSSPETPDDPDRTVMHVAAPVVVRDAGGDHVIGVLTVAKANRTTEPFIAASQREILRKGGWLLALSALIGVVMTVWLATRIARLQRYAQAVAAGERAAPPPHRRDELGDLGHALETMRRQLDGKAYVERYVQALTHEMKSPLAAIRGAAELLQEPLPDTERSRFAAHVVEQGARLTEMIDKLLALAAVEQQGWLQQRDDVSLDALLVAVVGDVAPLMEARGLVLQGPAPSPGIVVRGDPFLLRQAVRNLLDNAIAFSPRGGRIVLDLTRDEGSACIRVTDAGPGIPDYAGDRVFERFYSLPRPNGSRSSGLGLPFAREVAGLHGGTVAVGNGEGGGAVATLRLPLA
jgi:two-component system sensor histidine kinase CreC